MDTPATIIVADKASETVQTILLLLQEAGYHVLHTTSGAQCLETARQVEPDLILASVHLPDMSGNILCRRIKDDPKLLSIPILLLVPEKPSPDKETTAPEELPSDRERGYADSDGFVSWPIPDRDLLRRIETLLRIKKITEKSRTKSKIYKDMLENTPLPYQSLDINGGIARVNRAWLDILGYDEEKEVLGRSFEEFLDPEHKKHFPERFRNFKKKGRVCSAEFGMQRKDGSPLWISLDGRIAWDNKGQFEKTHCIFRDISIQKALEQQKKFQPARIMRPYVLTVALFALLFTVAELIYIFGFHNISSPLVPVGVGFTLLFLALAGGLLYFLGRRIRAMIHFYIREVEKREESLKVLNENLEATVERKTRALRASEKKYRRYIESSPLAIFVTDETGRYTEVNPAATTLLGYTRDEFLTMKVPEFHSSHQQEVVSKDFKLLRHRGKISREYTLHHKNGSEILVSLEAVALGHSGYMAFCQDIGERSRMQEDLLRNKDRLEALVKLGALAHAPIKELTRFALETAVSLTQSSIGFLAFVNEEETVVTMHSWSSQALEHCALPEPKTIPITEKTGMWAESLRSRQPYVCNRYDTCLPSRDGYPKGHIPITRHMNIPVIENGHVVVIAGVANKAEDYNQTDIMQITLLMQGMQDMLKHRQDEEKIRAREEQLRITLNSIRDGVITTDLLGQVLTMNPRAEKLTGWPLHEASGKLLSEIFHLVYPGTRKPLVDPVQNIMQERQNTGLNNPNILLSRNGTEYRITDSGASIKDHQGRVIGAVLVFRDVTEEFRIHEEMQKIHSLESIGTLAGGIAHDFNNILMGLTGNLDLAKNEIPDTHPVHASLVRAEEAVNKAVQRTKKLLAFAKGGEPIRENIALSDLAEKRVRFDLADTPIEPVFTTDEDLWLLYADKGQIEQIFSNLAHNAMQTMPEGGTLHVTLKNKKIPRATPTGLEPGNYVCLTVQDEGTGIASEDIERIFDPYFSTHETGSGLELATVYAIVKNHQGHIEVRSKKGEGSLFTIHLPASATASNSPAKTAAFSGGTPDTGYPPRILVMDDEEMVREVMTAMLQSLGYTTESVPDGAQAVALYAESFKAGRPFDAVIMDLTIPGGMGGKEAAAAN